ncbi:hypothetical protein ACLIYP_05455 [Streptomyces nanhaiensis]|uniref:hypothetical protein n=1 Tax=Streptomyces nanhaiensis TaxID=679319 RepID=UPI00399D1B98
MPAEKPTEGRCTRCKQPRPLFPYKPFHDCLTVIGPVNLIEAADHIAWFEEQGDRWCTARVERRDHYRRMCVPCHDREAKDEQHFVDTVLEEDHL